MPIVVYGVNHRTAPIGVREKLAYSANDVQRALAQLVESGVGGGVILSTCNRTEFYLANPGADAAAFVWDELSARLGASIEGYGYSYFDRAAVAHGFRVAAGMDSMLLGESQIQGQVREAWELARDTAGPVLNRLLQTALMVGSRVREETALGRGAASAASATVVLAKKIFGKLAGRGALVLGAGEMAEVALAALTKEGVRDVAVASRQFERATALAGRIGARSVRFDEAWRLMEEVDIVLCSTAAPHPIVTWERAAPAVTARRGRPLCLLDIAVPRDVEPSVAQLENVFLYDIDDLQGVVATTVDRRRDQLPAAERIVETEASLFCDWLASRAAVPAIKRFRAHVDLLRRRELERVLKRLGHLDAADRELVTHLSRALMNKFVHEPTVRLREAVSNGRGSQMTEALRYLFDLEGEDET